MVSLKEERSITTFLPAERFVVRACAAPIGAGGSWFFFFCFSACKRFKFLSSSLQRISHCPPLAVALLSLPEGPTFDEDDDRRGAKLPLKIIFRRCSKHPSKFQLSERQSSRLRGPGAAGFPPPGGHPLLPRLGALLLHRNDNRRAVRLTSADSCCLSVQG
uniref:Uncharacterized protein n=1 Tax=Trichuris muris TaxID=70415 RepID=A0A5S6QBL9_TRIMR